MGLLKFERHKFAFKADLGETGIASNAGFFWNADSLRWETRSAAKAVKLRRWADRCAELKLKNTFFTHYPAPEQILYPDNQHPTFFQIESALHALTRTPAYIADDMGLGKTITSILCMNTVKGRTLIICPPYLKWNWVDEIQKWSTHPYSVALVSSKTPTREELNAPHILILPDSLIDSPTIQHYMKDQCFEWLFVDEAHRYKNPETKRTVALIGSDKDEREFGKTYFNFVNASRRTVYLSGTPIPNGKPIELFPLLSRTAPESISWRDIQSYGKIFCAGRMVRIPNTGRRLKFAWDFSGASNLKKLREELRTTLMIRHLKKDVLTDLPPKTRNLVFLDAPEKLMAYEKKLLAQHPIHELLKHKSIFGELARYQKEVGISKIEPSIAYIKDLLEESNDKLVVFAHHISVVDGITQALKNFGALKIQGGLSAKEKHEAAKAFQTDEKHRVIVGNMVAMGEGLTLTKATGVIIVEPSWIPGQNEQAEDRVHRMTQNKEVYVRYLVLRGSLDERKLRSVLNKAHNTKEVMG